MKEENKESWWVKEFEMEFPFAIIDWKIGEENDGDGESVDKMGEIKSFISKVEERAKREERERIVRLVNGFSFSVPVGEGKFTFLHCSNCDQERYMCKQCLINLITKDNDNK